MKKILLLLAFAAAALTASANIEFQTLNNKGNNTTVVFTISDDEKDLTDGVGIDNVVLESCGKTYPAKKVSADFGKTTTVTAKFKKLKTFADVKVRFTLNGEEQCLNITKE